MTRNKDMSGSAQQIDLLSYTYNGNILTSVSDGAPAGQSAEGFSDGNPTGTDYLYNANGFLISDANKKITSISFTLMDRPVQITFDTGENIRYAYGGDGSLLNVSYYNSSDNVPTRTLDYVGELVFEDGVLTDIYHDLGRVRANDGFKYQYYLVDYLGNTRVVLQEDPGVFVASAGFEVESIESESSQFIGYDDMVRISAEMLNHTEGKESTYAMRLTGGYGENIGLAKSVSVLPGDTVRMEVFGKYIDIGEAKKDPAIMAILMAITACDPISMG
ncbi:hypothetical protein MM239_14915 [Belliella sp. DSM 111904]|uniref:YD repeat-containing protein n=1 Tax=Belliella filtrata TaxID=2923435 RepID=A0ABS9V2P4_9BACT|nr:hypothetical protein [Belliella filtrata]MCH7410697.1 hypothetical protein [Belliella filtrata]